MDQYTDLHAAVVATRFTSAVGMGSGSGCGCGSSSLSGSSWPGSSRSWSGATSCLSATTVTREPEGTHGSLDSTRTRS